MIRISCELGANMSRLRKRARITQTQLADLLTSDTGEHVTMHMVSHWERGLVDVPAAIIPSFCRIVHCSSFELYPHSDIVSSRDVSLISAFRSMGDDTKDRLYYLFHDWPGDKEALINLMVIHAVQDDAMRYVPDRMIIESYIDAVKRNDPRLDRRITPDLAYVQKAAKELLKDKE